MYIFEKQPADTVDYMIKMSDWFADLDDDDFIASVTNITSSPAFGVAAGDLQLGPDGLPDSTLVEDNSGLERKAKIWIGYGTDGVTYSISCLIITDLGRREEVDFKVKVKERP